MTITIGTSLTSMSLTALRKLAASLTMPECKSMTLLGSPEANPKLAKNMKVGVMSAPLHLAPYDLSGYQVCPMATEGCKSACLHTAGNPASMPQKERSRIARTKLYFEHRELFLALLIREIDALRYKAKGAGMKCGIRLNATSDIPWERVSFDIDNGDGYSAYDNLMQMFPSVSFYDYTKRPNRKDLPENYHVTFSLAEDNEVQAALALKNGLNVAVVFDTKRGQDLPKFGGFANNGDGSFSFFIPAKGNPQKIPVIDGDEHDYRPSDPKGVIVGLRAKGDAIGDTSGFVRAA